MYAANTDFTAERRLVEASDDPYEILDWIGEYRQHAREAADNDDASLERRFDALIEFATDQVVELKAARLRSSSRVRGVPDEGAPRAPRPEQALPHRRVAPVAPTPQIVVGPKVDPGEAGRRESARLRAREQAAASAAAVEAEAEQDRADREELRQLQERTAQAKARRDAALAATARIEADAKRVAAEAERSRRDRAKRQAALQAEEAERAAAEAEDAARAAVAMPVEGLTGASTPHKHTGVNRLADRPSAAPPAESVAELTPLAMLFQEQLAEVAAQFSSQRQTAVPSPASAAPPTKANLPARQPAASRVATAQPAPPTLASVAFTAPPPDPVDDLPPLTGADLTSFRNWLAVSQRALAVRLRVEQSSISKGEGKPTTILPPALRKALHQAMGEPRPDAGGAP